ncbi:DNA nuclease, lipoprotein [Neobacillus bataviensis LMG 21833]|uniref:DNA nuclease, lipoprotein n=1 Tax=Neobacillus bataviensis LMG 21833 TaxID=1117379 RepID=K6C6Y8_9BACI|nr:thermonuclease family protein [Neobacillus bataviensis]EKN66905.1 DNA nuclease, lipoprotein [Neobacillus bataviensis LMG 21833]
MRKTVAVGAFIVAATLLAYQQQGIIDEDQLGGNLTDHQVEQSSNYADEVANIAVGQVPITLVQAIDGDTIKAKVNGKVETIRYLLVDTPESRKPEMCVQPFAKEAYQRNNELVKGGSLSMEFEGRNSRDAYGRLLAYVYVDGVSIQETLLKEGYARVAYIMAPPYRNLKRYRIDENLAKESKLRIWSTKDYVTNRGFNGCVTEREVNLQGSNPFSLH